MANREDHTQAEITEAREKFADVSSTTLTPARVVVMCFERIQRDLQQAEMAIIEGRISDSHQLVAHAQEIISHLLEGIEMSDWDGADGLMSIYAWSYGELLSASIRNEAGRISRVREMLDSSGGAFANAAAALAVEPESATNSSLVAKA